jgi:hypothetical protein
MYLLHRNNVCQVAAFHIAGPGNSNILYRNPSDPGWVLTDNCPGYLKPYHNQCHPRSCQLPEQPLEFSGQGQVPAYSAVPALLEVVLSQALELLSS